jgi:hypothetical protein
LTFKNDFDYESFDKNNNNKNNNKKILMDNVVEDDYTNITNSLLSKFKK